MSNDWLKIQVDDELLEKISDAFHALQRVRKVEVNSKRYVIKAWAFETSPGRRAACVQIEEPG